MTIIYDCKYCQGENGLAKVQGDASVFRLGSSTTYNINPKTESGSSWDYFYTLNLEGNYTIKLTAHG